MENRLKPETYDVIAQLKEANIKTIMCTGDNILTALSVARDCEIIDSSDHVVRIEAKTGQDVAFYYDESPKNRSTQFVQTYDEASIKYAIDGQSFGVIRRENGDFLKELVMQGVVFARFSPDQKQQLIEALQQVGYFVGMWYRLH